MNYELAKELKEAGFPQKVYIGTKFFPYPDSNERVWDSEESLTPPNPPDMAICPTLSELIEACGGKIFGLQRNDKGWSAWAKFPDAEETPEQYGVTPEEAVARLWLALNKK